MALVGLVLVGLFSASRPIMVQTSPSATAKTIQVNGVGTVSATPDEALLYLAAKTQSATATQATQDNAATMTKVIQALVSLGIASNSITTVSYSLTLIYQNPPDQTSPPKIVGFAARNAIQVTLANVSMTGKVLNTAVMARGFCQPG